MNVVLINKKDQLCGVGCCWIPCLCNGCNFLYLETKDANSGAVLGKTQYVCNANMCFCIPKYNIIDASGNQKYRLRPDTCVSGLYVQCRYNSKKRKCCRFRFVTRLPKNRSKVSQLCLGKQFTPWSLCCHPVGQTNVAQTNMRIVSGKFPNQYHTRKKGGA